MRFGVNTLKQYGAPSEPGVALGRDDVWFIDIGPVWRDHEADIGETFVVGSDPERQRIVRDVHVIFDRVQQHWRDARPTGAELYRFAARDADSRGWQLDPDMAGHRIGDHPHAPYFDGTLAAVPFIPSSGLWMLEIQLRHPSKPYSAFVEDLLLDAADR